ncbi:MAG: C40 family peptidase [Actinomycetota bacterium]|nr:C40 family peptidase [Actinomycetota bacterium]MDQ6945166.1 C40 family peptidase [Actinomycetota bacterium]
MKRNTTKSHRRARSLACFVVVAVGAPLGMPGLASADPISDKRAQAQALADQISVLGNQEAALSEHYDAAVLAEQQAGAQVDTVAKQEAASQAAVREASKALRSDAVDAYTHGGNMNGGISSMSNLADAQNSLLRVQYAQTLATSQNEHRDQYRLAEAQASLKKAQLTAAQQQAAAQASKADSARRAVSGSAARLQATYKQTQGQLATLVAQAQAAKEAEQARQAQLAEQARQQSAQQVAVAQATTAQARATATAGTPASGPSASSAARATTGGQSAPTPSSPAPSAPAPPTGSGGGAAVAAAMSRLGDPYVWGAAGPNSFDCSGLTMWAWARAGVSLPHYSGSQYDSTTHISMSQLQPGDLVFFANPGEHMGMYIGGGRVIEAPYTGANVRIEPMYSQYVLASRPN